MPVIVDHKQRRKKISAIAASMIADLGMERLTIRAIARRAGCSTTSLTHYFTDKRMLLEYVYNNIARSTQARIDKILAEDPGDLWGLICEFLPLDKRRLRDWKVFIAFWDIAATDPHFAQEQKGWTDNAFDLIESTLFIRQERGELHHNDPADASRWLTLIMGISVQAVFDRRKWSPQRITDFLSTEFDR